MFRFPVYDDIVSVDDVNCKGKGVIDVTIVFFISLLNLRLDMFLKDFICCYSIVIFYLQQLKKRLILSKRVFFSIL